MVNAVDQSAFNKTDPSSPSDTVGANVHRTRQQPSWGGRLLGLIFLVLAFGSGWLVASMRLEHREKDVLSSQEAMVVRGSSTVMVTVEPVAHREVQRAVEALGTLHGYEEVSISAQVEGRVRKILHDVADNVKPGEPLLEIDPTDYQLSVQQADRALQVELAKLGLKDPPDSKRDLGKVPVVVKARLLMDHAKSRQERVARLAQTKNVSAEDAENAASEYRTSQAEYDNQMIQAESGLATIQMKQVELAVAREQLTNTKVMVPTPTVPVPGADDVTYVVSQRSVAEGTLVRPGTELFHLVIGQTLKLRVPVPERFSSEIQRNQLVQVFTATSSKPFPGTVTRIYPTVDSATRTFQVEIQVPNPNGELKPGSFAKAAILTRLDPDAVTVPLSALVQFAGITKIFLAENRRAKEIPVTVGTQTTEWIEIVKPALPRDAQVITSGQTAIADETSIVVRTAADKNVESIGARDAPPDSSDANGSSKHQTRGIRE